jgi:hypothetical protein
MQFEKTFSREELQGLYEKLKLTMIKHVVESIHTEVLDAARSGKVSHMIDIKKHSQYTVRSHVNQYIPTDEELVKGFQYKFPGCKVESTEIWEEVKAGIKEQKKGILIDWS